MATQVNETQYEVTDGVMHGYQRSNWLLKPDASDLENVPKVAAGSFAYTADMTFIAQYDGSEWVIIKGGD